MRLTSTVELVLRKGVSKWLRWRDTGGDDTYVVVVRLPHLQAAVSLDGAARVAVARDVLEGVAALPLATISSAVSFHCVLSAEVVPRSTQVNCLDCWMCLAARWVLAFMVERTQDICIPEGASFDEVRAYDKLLPPRADKFELQNVDRREGCKQDPPS